MPKVNTSIGTAKRAKYDDIYTQYADIEKEMNAYLEYDSSLFNGKTILLPCDYPEWSNFTKYFAQNFEMFALKKLNSKPVGSEQICNRFFTKRGIQNGQ